MGSSFSLSLSLPSSQVQPFWWVPVQNKVDPTQPLHLITTAASLRFGFLLRSSFQNLSRLYHVPRLKELWLHEASKLKEINFIRISDDIFASKFSTCLSFFNGGESTKGFGTLGMPDSGTSRRKPYNGRMWTNILLGINVLVFAAQMASQGKLLFWGAKINSLIDKGQIWRLVTSSFLHANIGHIMVNCFSLNSVGPTIENLSGPRRFLAIYFASAVASSATSYWFCKAPAVGASGAIFGLVGSLAVFVIRHRGMVKGGSENLQHIAQVIFLNMMFGILTKGIDNWGHLGGLLGGVAVSWFVGPAWKLELLPDKSRGIIVDKAPIRFLVNREKKT